MGMVSFAKEISCSRPETIKEACDFDALRTKCKAICLCFAVWMHLSTSLQWIWLYINYRGHDKMHNANPGCLNKKLRKLQQLVLQMLACFPDPLIAFCILKLIRFFSTFVVNFCTLRLNGWRCVWVFGMDVCLGRMRKLQKKNRLPNHFVWKFPRSCISSLYVFLACLMLKLWALLLVSHYDFG